MFILEYDKAVWVHNHYFLPLNTIKGNSMEVALDIILKTCFGITKRHQYIITL